MADVKIFTLQFCVIIWDEVSRWINEFQKVVTLEQDQNRCARFSSSLLQKEQFGSSFTLFFVKK